ncbi:hypothetical protein SUGI_0607030 [Cryptomeria japonica]|uniref:NAC domain-containing protein 10 n=1 Tax=Cryptomeria japonica TaxID=3369 RepID=UPI002414BEB4|nr:NAC domain-containing protein 10 [Cryptomeria japonica]XP_057861382.2 NAC domain-containing protein 10 [Cryptomeria japonica]XP_057861383.2 NAC domain-containing protein 10 [Cryptomeria japonica]XP_057861384.2 NAC domain-containing protein 10 [Cryptomeria japonica]GLJ30650.1 hypothetical protein SUGI_0607030 [Cryptomeria japonica]
MADPITRPVKDRNTTASSSSSIIDAKLEERGTNPCPRCGHKLQCKEGIQDWQGLPAGVKFDPTDQELLEHLEAKAEMGGSKPHPLIDEFIPTLQGEDGICYTHPEKLPGVTRDGLNRHFFHRPSKAYTTGTRKRRKIQAECDLQGGETRWHKTGKTRPVMVNGKQKGCKKILVLYTNFGKHRKPEKTNWVMHQYHLGLNEEEKEGELVVSKVFYQTQPRQCNWERTANDNMMEGNKSQEVLADVCRSVEIGRVNSLYPPINPGGVAAAAAASVVYNVDDAQQVVKTDKFMLPRTSFDEGISDSGKGSESSHCTPHSCDEHEEHEQQEKKSNINDDSGQGIGVSGHDVSSLMRFNNTNNDNSRNKGCDANVEHKASQHPHIHDAALAVLDEKHQKIQTSRPHKSTSRSSIQKLSLEDILIDTSATEMREEAAATAFTNPQDTEWFPFWNE